MAIRIQTEKPVIPIEIGDVHLEFEITDENIKRFYDTQDQMQKELQKIQGDDFESAKKVLQKSLDYFLGDGSFDKIYEVSPSIIVITKYFWAIVEGLEGEIINKAEATSKQKAQKYIRNKKKK